MPFVETLVVEAGSDDVDWHPDGFLLASDLVGTGSWPVDPSGDAVLAVDPVTGAVDPWGTGVPRPIGATLDGAGALFVAEYGEVAGVWTVPAGGGAGSLVQGGLSYPSSVIVADDGTLWVTEWGRDQVSRLREGEVELVAAVPGPVGLDRNAAGEVIVGSRDGWIYTLAADGTATPWALMPEGDPADFAVAGGVTYATSLDDHRVWRVDEDGVVTRLAGKPIPGDEDGSLDEARFDSPNGIAAAPDGDRLYVQQLNKRLRVIRLR